MDILVFSILYDLAHFWLIWTPQKAMPLKRHLPQLLEYLGSVNPMSQTSHSWRRRHAQQVLFFWWRTWILEVTFRRFHHGTVSSTPIFVGHMPIFYWILLDSIVFSKAILPFLRWLFLQVLSTKLMVSPAHSPIHRLFWGGAPFWETHPEFLGLMTFQHFWSMFQLEIHPIHSNSSFFWGKSGSLPQIWRCPIPRRPRRPRRRRRSPPVAARRRPARRRPARELRRRRQELGSGLVILTSEMGTLWWTNIAIEHGHWNSGFSH